MRVVVIWWYKEGYGYRARVVEEYKDVYKVEYRDGRLKIIQNNGEIHQLSPDVYDNYRIVIEKIKEEDENDDNNP